MTGTRRGVMGNVGRTVLAVLLAAMAAGQMSNVEGFVDIVDTYEVGGTRVATLLAAAFIVGEVTASIGLLAAAGRRRVLAASLGLGVAAAWTLLAVQAFARGLDIDNCGCFGVYAAQQLRWWVLLEDLEFVALAWWIRSRSAGHSPGGSRREDPQPAAVS